MAEPMRSASAPLSNLRRELDKHALSNTRTFVRALIDAQLKKLQLPLSFGQVRVLITALELACDRASRPSFLKKVSLEEGEPWQAWIQSLTKILEENELPTTVSKDGSSAFVALVQELQNCLPENLRRRANSTTAFAAAIQRTRHYVSQSTPTISGQIKPRPARQ